MSLSIRPCTEEDLGQLRRTCGGHALHHHEECFAQQQRGEATYLLAWDGRVNVGMATLLTASKYPEVARRCAGADGSGPVEINALEASPQGRGTGTALLAAAEDRARALGRGTIGLACTLDNTRARRLYERMGYELLEGLQVLDVWTEYRADGEGPRHEDPCVYLVKELG